MMYGKIKDGIVDEVRERCRNRRGNRAAGKALKALGATARASLDIADDRHWAA